MDDALLPPRRSTRRGKNFPLWPFQRWNHNVVCLYLAELFATAADSMRNGAGVEAAFIFELMGKSNEYVGYQEAVAGLTSLVVALPIGWAADRFPRTRLIRMGVVFMSLYAGLCAFAVIYGLSSASHALVAYYAYAGANVLAGIVSETIYGPAEALFIDSTPVSATAQHSIPQRFRDVTVMSRAQPRGHHRISLAQSRDITRPHLARTSP